jgi:L-ascorbate metabolism protein UlaG (beta-lactamase superfamily)
MQTVIAKIVMRGHASTWWLGGSGFIVKSPQGVVTLIDPYLSNAVEEIFGLPRAFPAPLNPEAVRADVVISTHWHEDHLDPGSIPIIARNNLDAKFVMPPSAMARALSWGVRRSQIVSLRHTESTAIGDMRIEAMPARHEAGIPGWEVPDAMGALLEIGGLKIYHSGDTEYDVRLRRLKQLRFDVALLCINGAGGNMDAFEAALLAWQLGASLVVPIHHLLWARKSDNSEETLDPKLFVDTYARLGGKGRAIVPTVAEELDLMKAR